MNKNKLFYEERPYIYAALAVIALAYAKRSKIALFSGLILVVCSFLVFKLRQNYKKRQEFLKQKRQSQINETNKDFVINNNQRN